MARVRHKIVDHDDGLLLPADPFDADASTRNHVDQAARGVRAKRAI
jgi:hypothetical protein